MAGTKTVTDNQCDGLLIKLGIDPEPHWRTAIRNWLEWLDAHEPNCSPSDLPSAAAPAGLSTEPCSHVGTETVLACVECGVVVETKRGITAAGRASLEPKADACDAARYRWLREGSFGPDAPQVYADDDCNTWLRGDELDKALDSAMNR